jgi:uncharacterized protein involved in exopolysaccharide biosynthesis
MTSGSDPSVEESHLLDHLEVLRKRWRVLVATFLGFVAVAALAIYRMPPVYRATARVIVGSGLSQGPLGDRGSAIDGYLLERLSFETQIEVIRSEPVALRAARALGWIAEGDTREAEVAAADSIKNMVSVDHLDDTRIALLRAMATTPERARDVANAVADAYIAYSHDQRSEAHRRSVAWLTHEIGTLRDQVRTSEERLLDYLSREQIDLSHEAQVAQAAPQSSDEGLVAGLRAAELELSELLRRYRDRHPKVIEARARIAHLRKTRTGQQTQLAEDHRKLIQYRLLKRDLDLDHQMYDLLLKKLKEADLSTDKRSRREPRATCFSPSCWASAWPWAPRISSRCSTAPSDPRKTSRGCSVCPRSRWFGASTGNSIVARWPPSYPDRSRERSSARSARTCASVTSTSLGASYS